ncbi:MAG: tetratricopeptide repeat protein, partial [Longimicrobiales bacterium]
MDRDQLLEQALGLGEEGNWQDAAQLLRDHLEDFPDDAAVHCWLGVAEQELGLGGVAYERFKHALSLGSEDPYVLATVGNGIAYFDDPDAEQTLRTASMIGPDIPVTRLMYGVYLAREGLTEQGIEELGAARELDPDDPQIAYELGVGWALAGDHDRATDVLADAVRLDPEDGWARV